MTPARAADFEQRQCDIPTMLLERLFGERRLKEYRDGFQALKGNRQVCATTVAITQNLLLADAADIDHIGEAVRKIQAHGAELARA